MTAKKESLWHRWWGQKSENEKKWLKSFLPLIGYTVALVYVIYLSILNTVNRGNAGGTVKNWWFGGEPPAWVQEQSLTENEIEESFRLVRKRVSGGR